MFSAKKICKRKGCRDFAVKDGYCEEHSGPNRFSLLNATKTTEKGRFYSGRKWTKKSIDYRNSNPFCERCWKRDHKKVLGKLVHHEPELDYLLEHGLDPYNDKYLETLCFPCHQSELNKKKGH